MMIEKRNRSALPHSYPLSLLVTHPAKFNVGRAIGTP